MQRVLVSVVRFRAYSSDVSFEVFGDLGSGVVDYDHPLTSRPVPLWPDAGSRAGQLLDGHLMLRHLDSVVPDGWLEGVHLADEHHYPGAEVVVESPGYVFGRFVHAVRMVDGAGNVSGTSESSVTVNSSPTIPTLVRRGSYDEGLDQISFSFQGSRFDGLLGT